LSVLRNVTLPQKINKGAAGRHERIAGFTGQDAAPAAPDMRERAIGSRS
jgi:NitT/TauT family transport system ATP-binding protein